MEGDEAEASTSHDKKKLLRKFKSICVFCGSRAGYNSSFTDAALQLGKLMVILFWNAQKHTYMYKFTRYVIAYHERPVFGICFACFSGSVRMVYDKVLEILRHACCQTDIICYKKITGWGKD